MVAMYALFDLGYSFDKIVSIECCEDANHLATKVCPEIDIYHSKDVMQLGEDILTQKFDIMLNTGNCEPFSCSNPKARGFKDKRVLPWLAACQAKRRWQSVNPRLATIDEQVVVAPHLKAQGAAQRMDSEWGGKHLPINSSRLGGACSRNIPC